jgi:hypothetical protein
MTVASRCCALALTVAGGLLAGCSGDDAGAHPSTTPQTSAPVPVTSAPTGPATSSRTAPTQPTTVRTTGPSAGSVRLEMVELASEDPSPGGQFVVVRNGTSSPVDLRCWTLRSASTGTNARITEVPELAPGAAARLFADRGVLGNGDTLRLLDRAGREADRTPQLTDRSSDDRLWSRDRTGGWRFGRDPTVPAQIVDGRLVVATGTC